LKKVKYYKCFLEQEFNFFISTRSKAEFCVLGIVDQLPLKNLIVLTFNINHAKRTGELAAFIYKARKESEFNLYPRSTIIIDAKLFAQTV
jgi:hypothetical protein